MENTLENNGNFTKIHKKNLQSIYEVQYIDIFPDILNISQEIFFDRLKNQISLYLNIVQKTSTSSLDSKIQSDYCTKYQNDKAKIINYYNIINKIPEKNLIYLNYTNCYVHCHKNLQAIHICGNQLIKYADLIFCTQCKKVYTEKLIKLYCSECHREYFSEIRKISDKKLERYLPVTFIKNHCKTENEIIKCINCGEFLYYSTEKNNKNNTINSTLTETYCYKCKKIYDMRTTEFKCNKCNQLFKSDAKLYNAFPEKIKKLLCKIHILLQKKYAIPKTIKNKKCDCDLTKTDRYYHNKKDMGILYTGYGEYENYIICDECHKIFDINDFKWKCPICLLNCSDDEGIIPKELNIKKPLNTNRTRKKTKKIIFPEKLIKKKKSLDEFKIKPFQKKIAQFQDSTKRSMTIEHNTDFSDNNIFCSTSENTTCKTKDNKKYKKKKLILSFKDVDSNYKTINTHPSNHLLHNIKERSKSTKKDNVIKNIEKYFFGDKKKLESKMKNRKPANVNINTHIKFDSDTNFYYTSEKNKNNKNNNIIICKKNSMRDIKKNKDALIDAQPIDSRYLQSAKNLPINKNQYYSQRNYNYNNAITDYNPYIYNNKTKNIDINYYKFIECIGTGSFGQTYLVEDPKTHIKYALKKLVIDNLIQLKETQDQYNMLLNLGRYYPEIKVVKIYGIQTTQLDKYNYVIYILMEVANCDWETEILNRRQFNAFYTEKEILLILSNLVQTFANLQRIGICHRDIKPQNVLCFGKAGFKVTDFGEAKYNSSFKNGLRLTLRGTQLYMSPLLYKVLKTNPLKGAVHNPFKSDVFSLGMCFLFACSLDFKPLYDLRNCESMETVTHIVNKSIHPRYSLKIVRLLIKMLNLNENLRPDFLELEKMIK